MEVARNPKVLEIARDKTRHVGLRPLLSIKGSHSSHGVLAGGQPHCRADRAETLDFAARVLGVGHKAGANCPVKLPVAGTGIA